MYLKIVLIAFYLLSTLVAKSATWKLHKKVEHDRNVIIINNNIYEFEENGAKRIVRKPASCYIS